MTYDEMISFAQRVRDGGSFKKTEIQTFMTALLAAETAENKPATVDQIPKTEDGNRLRPLLVKITPERKIHVGLINGTHTVAEALELVSDLQLAVMEARS